MFSWPVSLIRRSSASRTCSHSAKPYGRTTMQPRTGAYEASSASRTTSRYHWPKSADRDAREDADAGADIWRAPRDWAIVASGSSRVGGADAFRLEPDRESEE